MIVKFKFRLGECNISFDYATKALVRRHRCFLVNFFLFCHYGVHQGHAYGKHFLAITTVARHTCFTNFVA